MKTKIYQYFYNVTLVAGFSALLLFTSCSKSKTPSESDKNDVPDQDKNFKVYNHSGQLLGSLTDIGSSAYLASKDSASMSMTGKNEGFLLLAIHPIENNPYHYLVSTQEYQSDYTNITNTGNSGIFYGGDYSSAGDTSALKEVGLISFQGKTSSPSYSIALAPSFSLVSTSPLKGVCIPAGSVLADMKTYSSGYYLQVPPEPDMANPDKNFDKDHSALALYIGLLNSSTNVINYNDGTTKVQTVLLSSPDTDCGSVISKFLFDTIKKDDDTSNKAYSDKMQSLLEFPLEIKKGDAVVADIPLNAQASDANVGVVNLRKTLETEGFEFVKNSLSD